MQVIQGLQLKSMDFLKYIIIHWLAGKTPAGLAMAEYYASASLSKASR